MSRIAVSYNPFDHINPVSDPSLFVGREEELADITYYLQQSKASPRPFNLAILGERGSGKTSLLNIAATKARDLDFCVARIDLNESDAKSPMSLLLKIFDTLLHEIVRMPRPDNLEHNCFGGEFGQVYSTYLDTVTSYALPDPLHRTFTFPVQYAMAMAAGRFEAPVSENAFKSDLEKLRLEVGRPVALLFDECNVLGGERSLLQMLRNVFMNTHGYMLILSGTPALFPLMNEVFSPIARQFKRIELLPFKDRHETKRLILTPLQSVGIGPGTGSGIERLDDSALNDIHKITAGKPHEIQLVCHCILKKLESTGRSTFELSVDVLDEVLSELKKGVDLAGRPTISAIREMDEKQIKQAGVFFQADGATFEQFAFAAQAFPNKHCPEPLSEVVDKLVSAGLLTLDEGRIVFSGDDFDRVYVRYYASRRGVRYYFNFFRPEHFIRARLLDFLYEDCHLTYLFSREPGEPKDDEIFGERVDEDYVEPVAAGEEEADSAFDTTVFKTLFFANLEAAHMGDARLPAFEISLSHGPLQVCELLIPADVAKFSPEECSEHLRALSNRVAGAGGELRARRLHVNLMPKVDVDELAREILSVDETNTNTETAGEFEWRFVDAYTQRHDRSVAKMYADYLFESNRPISAVQMNNLGYFFLVTEQYNKARACLDGALRKAENASEPDESGVNDALIGYNLALLSAKTGDWESALKHFSMSKDRLKRPNERASCLLVAHVVNRRLTLQEEWRPRYGDAVHSFEAALKRVADGSIENAQSIEVTLGV
ncbi:MAG TPA: AAA family ATPase [Verrucomicrobiae bacterium]|nr:AAA family ATPase [Verrucomicrobiae bacterium]